MSLIVTSTETDLITELNNKNFSVIVKPLDIGDAHICYENNIVYILERKAKGDLLASIKDIRNRKIECFNQELMQKILYI